MTDVVAARPSQRHTNKRPNPKAALGGFLDAGGHPNDQTQKEKDTKRVVDVCSGDQAIDALLAAAKEDKLGPSTPVKGSSSSSNKARSSTKAQRTTKKTDPLASRSNHRPTAPKQLDSTGRSPGTKSRRKMPHRSRSSVEKVSSDSAVPGANNGSIGNAAAEVAPRRRTPPHRSKSMDEKLAPQRIPRSLARMKGGEGSQKASTRTAGISSSNSPEGSLRASRTTTRDGSQRATNIDDEVIAGPPQLSRKSSMGEKRRKPKKEDGPSNEKSTKGGSTRKSTKSPTSVIDSTTSTPSDLGKQQPAQQQQQPKPNIILEYGKSAQDEDETEYEEDEAQAKGLVMQFDPTADNHCLLVDRNSDHFPSQTITLDIDYGYDFDTDNEDEEDNNDNNEDENEDRRGGFFTSNRIFGIRSFNAKFKSNKAPSAAGCENKHETKNSDHQSAGSVEEPGPTEKRGLFGFAKGGWSEHSGRGWGSSGHSGHVGHEMLDDSVNDMNGSFSQT